ncbi:hypothetical protein ISU10_03475 [Nocardioides agariphilus]|uniref:Uncharacterized protein n=1 Tax=Nocardioides agariphilus TaxID=433664 RepID=A0A930YH85_9ACTN|nr:hypothetical protein [Nocardioides agariphilus]MBF4766827.1 hypothetical protein [Nocardioides agariphilus]
MTTTVRRTIARLAVAVAAATVGATTLLSAPTANAAFVGPDTVTKKTYVDLTPAEHQNIYTSVSDLAFNTADGICKDQVIPQAGFQMSLTMEFACPTLVERCARKVNPRNEIAGIVFNPDNTYVCTSYQATQMTTAQLIAFLMMLNNNITSTP